MHGNHQGESGGSPNRARRSIRATPPRPPATTSTRGCCGRSPPRPKSTFGSSSTSSPEPARAGSTRSSSPTPSPAATRSIQLTDLWLDSADVDALLAPGGGAMSRAAKLAAAPGRLGAGRPLGDDRQDRRTRPTAPEIKAKLARFVRAPWFTPPFGGPEFTNLLLEAFDAMAKGPKAILCSPIISRSTSSSPSPISTVTPSNCA